MRTIKKTKKYEIRVNHSTGYFYILPAIWLQIKKNVYIRNEFRIHFAIFNSAIGIEFKI
jgi:hypothetical protein